MFNIGNYRILENISKSRCTEVYRGQKEGDPNTVIIKYMRARFPSTYEISRFKQEYEIIRNLELEGVVKTFELIHFDSGVALILEDFDAVSLKEVIRKQSIDTPLFLRLAMKIAETLGALHKKDIVHNDIKPGNILVSRDFEQVKVTDFGISQIITRENEELYNPEVIEGTLKYMSPEQTGRMNSSIDYRTDLYSLGITFYEMLTGIPPFNFKDPLEIIHAHIAREVPPPYEINPDVPKPLSDIILGLLIKPAEERYQNAFGLLYDLKQAWEQWRQKRAISEFELATHDFSLKFNIPQQMVGRENESRILLKTFERVAGQGVPEILLVTGVPGVGKSFLVDELHKPIVASRGYYISGKFEQFRQNVPYSAIIQAFIKLIRQLLVESNDKLNSLKKQIQEALGDNAKVITDILPQLKAIIGEPREVPQLGPEESENRFHYVFKNFLRVFTGSGHPLLLVLDDLQWADMASLNLIQNVFADPANGPFLLIGIYRSNEVSDFPALNKILDEIKSSNLRSETIHITPLDSGSIRKLLATFLRLSIADVASLADIVYTKTNGNPFFINQFMKRLYDKKMLEIESSGKWKWDAQAILDMQITDNVVDLMVQKIKEISPDAQALMKTASCIGNRFDIETLCLVGEKTPDQLFAEMKEPLDTGLVFIKKDMCYFQHDRIQEAAYSLLDKKEKIELHYKIGHYFLKKFSLELPEKVFFVVNHFNQSQSLITDPEEKQTLIDLNIQAGEKAKSANAYDAAAKYYETALSLLPEGAWKTHYPTIYQCYSELGYCEYLKFNFEKAGSIFHTVLSHSRSNFDQAKLYNLMAVIAGNTGKHAEAIELGLNGLKKLEVKVNPDPRIPAIIIELYKTRLKMSGKRPQDLSNLPAFKDERTQMIMELLMICIVSASFCDRNKFVYFLLTGLQLTLKHGNCSFSPFIYCCYGFFNIAKFKKYQTGLEFGNLALQVNQNYYNPSIKTQIYCLYGLALIIWKEHLKRSLDYLNESLILAFQNGEIRFALYSEQTIILNMLAMGAPLTKIAEFNEKYFDFVQKAKEPGSISYSLTVRQLIKSLKNQTAGVTSLNDDTFDEEKHLSRLISENIPIVTQRHFLHKAMLCYLFGDLSGSLGNILNSQNYLEAAIGNIYETEHYFYYFLIIIALIRKTPTLSGSFSNKTLKKSRLIRKAKSIQNRFKKLKNCAPANFNHKYLLITAELNRLRGNVLEAQRYYVKAIAEARANSFVHIEAIACELTAMFFHEQGNAEISNYYMSRAIYSYSSWGATAKAEQLEQAHPELTSTGFDFGLVETGAKQQSPSSTGSTAPLSLDTISAVKATQIIASEINFHNLLVKIMEIALENSGAHKGLLIIKNEKDKNFYIEAAGEIDKGIEVLNSIPIQESEEIPHSIFNYVLQTNENIIINDVQNEEILINDPFLKTHDVKSILCSPIKYKAKKTGIIYLENRYSPHVFTADRLQTLQILSSQAAISIENAKLYQELSLTQEVIVFSLSALAETRDIETGNHILRTQHYVKALAEKVRNHPRFQKYLDDWTIDFLFKAAPLHDIGKVGVPDKILLKPGKLDHEEFEEIKKHTIYGLDTLEQAETNLGSNSFMGFAREIAYTHHEKWDGTGYPRGLKGDEIPISGRIMAIADVYDALISKRIYKPAYSHETAVDIIKEGRGSQFDPDLVDAFLSINDHFLDIANQYFDMHPEKQIQGA